MFSDITGKRVWKGEIKDRLKKVCIWWVFPQLIPAAHFIHFLKNNLRRNYYVPGTRLGVIFAQQNESMENWEGRTETKGTLLMRTGAETWWGPLGHWCSRRASSHLGQQCPVTKHQRLVKVRSKRHWFVDLEGQLGAETGVSQWCLKGDGRDRS